MTPAKLTLSAKELELVCNTDWILTKHDIIRKVYELFGTCLPEMQQQVSALLPHLPNEVSALSPKIAKGEHYRQLPYVMADYPRYFTKDNTLAIRMLFWWGNFFSISLQAEGSYQQQLAPQLVQRREELIEQGYWIAVGATPWEHHFERDNFRMVAALSKMEFEQIVSNASFLKMAKKTPLTEWNEVPFFFMKAFREMTGWLADQAPSR